MNELEFKYDALSEILADHARQINIKKENLIINQLAELGHRFETEKELKKFAQKRITIVTQENSEFQTIWLDFGKDNCHILAQFYISPKINFEVNPTTLSQEYKVDIGVFPQLGKKLD